jgi:hypothetical protein
MRTRLFGSITAALVLVALPARAEVRVTIANGLVSISAQDATVRQILTEWARVGQTRIVNVERLGGAPMSIELTDVPEGQALDTLLRSYAGYLAAPRAVDLPNASHFDRVVVLATASTPVSSAPARPVAPAPAPQPPVFQPPQFIPPSDEPSDDQPRQGPNNGPPGPPRGPAFSTFPQPPVGGRQAPAAPSAAPAAPIGVSTPGMPVPVPQQQQQQGRPNDQP